jgi:hypothetical protein
VVDRRRRDRDHLSSYHHRLRRPDVEDPSSADPDLLLGVVVRDYCNPLVGHPFDLVVVVLPYYYCCDDLLRPLVLVVVALGPDDYQMVSDDDQNHLDPLLHPESSMRGSCLSLFLDCSLLVE